MDHEPIDLTRFRESRKGELSEPRATPLEQSSARESALLVDTLEALSRDLMAVPELPSEAPREQLFEFAALAGLAAACGPDLLQNPDAYRRAAEAYLERWYPTLGPPPTP